MNGDRWRQLLSEERRRAEEALEGYRVQLAAATGIDERDDAEGHIAQLKERLAAVAQAQERLDQNTPPGRVEGDRAGGSDVSR